VAVTYLAVPEYGTSNSNTLQIELFFNGIIRMTWLQIDAVNAVVGLARGIGQPVGFVESDFSLASACNNSPPELAEIADRVMSVGEPLVITNTATDGDLPAQTLSFSLEAAPIGARLNPTSGIFRWTPNSGQGSTTNVITLRVTDNGTPNLSATRTFTVIVMPHVEVSFGIGEVVLLAGESTNLAVNVISSLPLTNLGFRLSFAADRLTNVVATNWGPNIASVNVQQLVPSQAEFYLPTVTGSVIQGTQQLFTVIFTALTNQSSAFVPVSVEDVAAAEANGTTVTSGVGMGTRLIIIGQEPLLEGVLGTTGQRSVVLYGQLGALYTLESATNLLSGTLWLPVLEQFAQTNKGQAIMVPTVPARTIFYRARKE
jgi:hypothetical protein